MVDPELDPSAAQDGPALPTRGSDEFKPFIRRLPEFKFWYVLLLLSTLAPQISCQISRICVPGFFGCAVV
jgi:hypothetical protein